MQFLLILWKYLFSIIDDACELTHEWRAQILPRRRPNPPAAILLRKDQGSRYVIFELGYLA